MNIRKTALAAMACFSLSTATPPGELVTHLFPHKDGEFGRNKGGNQNDWIEVGRNGSAGWITYKTGGADLSHSTGSSLTLYIDKVYTGGTIKVFALTQAMVLPEMAVEGGDLHYDASSPVATAAIASDDQEKILRVNLGSLLNQGPFHGLVIEAVGNLRVDFGAKESPVQPLIELRYAFATAAQVQQAIDAGLAAQAAAAAARQAADDAEASASAADASATSAQGYASAAGVSAGEAAGYSATAGGYASAAQTSASAAAGYEAGAAGYAGQASGYAAAAGSSAGEAAGYSATAGGYASAAQSSASAAAVYEAGAAGYAGQASGYASAAGASAGEASGYAGAAAGSADAALTSASAAAGYETGASNYAGLASGYATAAGAASGSCTTAAGAAAGSADAAAASAAAAEAASTGGGLPAGAALFTTSSTPPDGFASTGIRVNYETAWGSVANSPIGRYDLASAVMGGRLYSTGGYNGSAHINNVQSYDPVTNTWGNHTGIPVNVHLHTITEWGGSLYVIAGLSGDGTVYKGMYRYNISTDNWTTMPSMPGTRYHHAAAAVDGKIYVFGGYTAFSGSGLTQTVYAYDIASNTWSQKANMPTARAGLAATAVDGRIYVIGGVIPGPTRFATTEIYDPATDTWSTGASMPTGRSHHGLVSDGSRIYAMGGEGSTGVLNTVVQYDVAQNSWVSTAILQAGRYKFASGLINGKIYVSQGSNGSILSSTEVYTLPKTLYLVEKAP